MSRREARVAALGPTLCALLVATALAGCSVVGHSASWERFSVDALEVDPPFSVADLAEDADAIVVARAVDVVDVPSDESGLPEDTGVVAITFQVDEWVRGDGADRITVVRPRQPVDSVEDLRAGLPDEPLLLFAYDAGYGGHLALTSDLGAIAQRGDSLVTVFDEQLASNVVPEGAATLDDVIAAIP